MTKIIKKIFVFFIVFLLSFLFVSCTNKNNEENEVKYTINVKDNIEFIYEVGENNVDFTKYFEILDEKGNSIEVKDE